MAKFVVALAFFALGLVLLRPSSALAAPGRAPHLAPPFTAARGGGELPPPPLVEAHPAFASTPAPDCSADPAACAASLTAPIDGLGQVGLASLQKVLWWVGLLAFSVLGIRGIVHYMSGQPHGMAQIIFGFAIVLILLVVGFSGISFVNSVHQGPIQIQTPIPIQ